MAVSSGWQSAGFDEKAPFLKHNPAHQPDKHWMSNTYATQMTLAGDGQACVRPRSVCVRMLVKNRV